MNENDWLEKELQRAMGPQVADTNFKRQLARIPQVNGRTFVAAKWSDFGWHWLLGLGMAGAVGVFALGIWFGASLTDEGADGLAMLAGAELGYMEELL